MKPNTIIIDKTKAKVVSIMPKIGLRNIKTAISVFLCIAIFHLFHREYPFYACIAAVITLQSSVATSVSVGKNRMIGTCIGGLIGLFFSLINGKSAVLCGIGIVLVIYICNIVKQQKSVVIACIVFIAIMTNMKGTSPYIYTINRVIDTFIGIIISVLVNLLLPSPNPTNE